MKSIKAFFKRLFCKHDFQFKRNIHGDEIIESGNKRSVWQCPLCEKLEWRDELH